MKGMCMKVKANKGSKVAIALSIVATLLAIQIAPANAADVPFRPAVPGSGKGLTIGMIGLADSIGFGKSVHDSMALQAKLAGAKFIFCDSNLDAAKALNCAKLLKLKHVNGYLNFQPVSTASAAICKAGPQNVPIISIDIEQDPCNTAFMGADNSHAGFVAGVAIGNYFKKNFNCQYDAWISLEDYGVGLVNEARMGGYRDGFASICGALDATKVHKYDAGRLDLALKVMPDALTNLPNMHHIIVVAINDEGIQGAFSAAKAVGRQTDLYAASQGAAQSAWCDIKNNPNWIGATAYFPDHYGEIGIPYLIDLIKGKKVPYHLNIQHVSVNAGNITKVFPTAAAWFTSQNC